ncbi:unnamed protein product [Phytomonas sp. EM1]|nr:unnamed protein product [Phytomonas sp. EM1]|eukprot:CCW64121.1 unnamed protein product [Phytomonas sp. isolate EM1]
MYGAFRKYQKGNSGAYTEDYHKLLGKTPWIVVKNLVPRGVSLYPVNESKPPVAAKPHDAGHVEGDFECDSSMPPSFDSRLLAPSRPDSLSEGDVATAFSQFGNVVDVRFVRHRKTGHFLGTAFVCFENYLSGIVAADEMNSNFEDGDPVVLDVRGTEMAAAGDLTAARARELGIVVERCEEVEIPRMGSTETSARGYAEWANGKLKARRAN